MNFQSVSKNSFLATLDSSALEARKSFFQIHDKQYCIRDRKLSEKLDRRFEKFLRFFSLLKDERANEYNHSYFYQRFGNSVGESLNIIYQTAKEILETKNDFHETFADKKVYCNLTNDSRVFMYLQRIWPPFEEKITDRVYTPKQIFLTFDVTRCKLRVIKRVSKKYPIACFYAERGVHFEKQYPWTTYLEKFSIEGSDLYVHKYYSGGNLYRFIIDNTLQIEKSSLIMLVKHMVFQMYHMHKNKIIHNDVKLENFVWKLSRKRGILGSWIDMDYSGYDYKFVGICWGSKGSMPPETILNFVDKDKEKVIDFRNDIYSLGLSVAFLLNEYIDEEVFAWIKQFTDLQILDPNLMHAYEVATDLKKYNYFLKKNINRYTLFVLRLLAPNLECRPKINKVIEHFKNYIY